MVPFDIFDVDRHMNLEGTRNLYIHHIGVRRLVGIRQHVERANPFTEKLSCLNFEIQILRGQHNLVPGHKLVEHPPFLLPLVRRNSACQDLQELGALARN